MILTIMNVNIFYFFKECGYVIINDKSTCFPNDITTYMFFLFLKIDLF